MNDLREKFSMKCADVQYIVRIGGFETLVFEEREIIMVM